jgi:hypothetical protein
MQVTLTPHSEEIVKSYLAARPGQSAEELIERALERFTVDEGKVPSTKTVADAVAHILESRKRVTLGGLKIKDLIEEGRKY